MRIQTLFVRNVQYSDKSCIVYMSSAGEVILV